MKIIKLNLILLFCISVFSIDIMGQEHCLTPQYSSNQSSNASPSNSSTGTTPKILRVYFHVVRRSNGTGGYLQYQVKEAFNILNRDFQNISNPKNHQPPLGLISFSWDGCIDYIDSDSYFNGKISNNIFNVNKNNDGIDIYLFPPTGVLWGGLANGIATIAQFQIFGRIGTIPTALTSIISHEMGHVLNLYHTHRSCDEAFGGIWENTDETNCEDAGDYCCDTPADPNMDYNVSNCLWTGVPEERCGLAAPEPWSAYNPDEKNIMAYSLPECTEYFSYEQYDRMHTAIGNLSFLQQCVVQNASTNGYCNCPENDIIINENTIVDHDWYVTGNIILTNNSTLTVKSTVFFKENKFLEVTDGSKLVMDGGKLTSCGLNWKGVIAKNSSPFSQTFAVELKNSSTIEKAEIGINTLMSTNSWPYTLSGAKITSDNSTFQNCGIGINFGPFGFASPFWSWTDQSKIQNSGFFNCGTGAILENNLGVEFVGSSFSGSNTIGIDVRNSQIIATGCDFGGYQGILFSGTWPSLIGSGISNNTFFSTEGIYIDGQGNASPHDITGNFFTSTAGISSFSQVAFNIQSNDFANTPLGVSSWYTGDDYNLVSDNGFLGNNYGNSAYGYNNIEYLDNCFDYSSITDIEVFHGASIFPSQGNPVLAAGNCFSFIPTKILTGIGSSPFEYYVLKNTDNTSCKKPGTGNFSEEIADSEDLLNCGSGVWTTLPPKYRNCIIPKNLEEKKTMEAALKAEILRIKNDPSISSALKKWLIARYERCLKKLKGEIGLQIIKEETNGKEEAITYFSNQQLFSHKIMAYAIIMEEGELERASVYLNGLPTENSAQSDFVFANNIFLSYLENRNEFVLSITTKESLRVKALQENELSGYIRAIYFKLTGERLRIPLSHIQNVEPRSSHFNNSSELSITSYPNPILGNEHIIEIKTNVSNQKYSINLKDITGKIMKTSNAVIGKNIFDMADIVQGVYIIEVLSEYDKLYTNKVVRL